jgi:hypothetical protein
MSQFGDSFKAMFPGPVVTQNSEFSYLASLSVDIPQQTRALKENPKVRAFLNPYIPENAGIYLSYFTFGIAQYILQAPMQYYLINTLKVSAAQYNAYFILLQLPKSLKFLAGILTDSVPILGYRRKSWIFIAWCLYITVSFLLAMTEDPNFVTITSLMFLQTVATLMTDVCHDAICIDRARYECEEIIGCYKTGTFHHFPHHFDLIHLLLIFRLIFDLFLWLCDWCGYWGDGL